MAQHFIKKFVIDLHALQRGPAAEQRAAQQRLKPFGISFFRKKFIFFELYAF